jgi:predicted DsbA family dithiol-disulfide isomerase
LEAFFVESQDIGSIDVLTKLAGEVGLDQKEFAESLRTHRYREAHRQALRHAYEEAGVTGVQMVVIGSQVLTGLQDRETLGAIIKEEVKASKDS